MLDVFFVIQIVLAVALVASVLLQNSNADGLSGLSGSSSTGVVSGRASANFMVKLTTVLAVLFMLNSLFLGNLVSRTNAKKDTLLVNQVQNENQSKSIPSGD
jgi:preprotein translocase subunit SecG